MMNCQGGEMWSIARWFQTCFLTPNPGVMIQFDFRIFLKWVGEKPPTRLKSMGWEKKNHQSDVIVNPQEMRRIFCGIFPSHYHPLRPDIRPSFLQGWWHCALKFPWSPWRSGTWSYCMMKSCLLPWLAVKNYASFTRKERFFQKINPNQKPIKTLAFESLKEKKGWCPKIRRVLLLDRRILHQQTRWISTDRFRRQVARCSWWVICPVVRHDLAQMVCH